MGDACELRGQVAVVTGGDTTIGQVVVSRLARQGVDVVLAGHAQATLEVAAEHARAVGRRALALSGATCTPGDCARLVARTVSELGQLDMLVNIVGEQPARPLERWDAQGWRAVIDSSLRSAFVLSQAVGGHLSAQGRGAIVTVCCAGGRIGLPHGVIAAGLEALTQGLASAWRARGVRVNGIAANTGDGARCANLSEEIAAAVLFCASGASEMSGQTLTVSGSSAANR